MTMINEESDLNNPSGYMIAPGSWPSAVGAWPDSPWTMTGRMVTGYFELPWSVLKEITHPELLPRESATVASRIRFYELNGAGHAFREAVMGSPVQYDGVDGESTFVIWTDSEIYQTWGREVFGWPVLRGTIALAGPLWDPIMPDGATGTCGLDCPDGAIALDVDRGLQESSGSQWRLTRSDWLSPRKVIRHGDLAEEEHEVLRITPTIIRAGSAFTASGRVSFRLATGHPLADLSEMRVGVEVIDGFEMVIGNEVEVVGRHRNTRT